MKLKIDWAALGKALWEAVKPVLLAAIGGGMVALTGCSSMGTAPRGQTTEIVAVGIPAVAWISHTSQEADHRAGDTNVVTQSNKNDVNPSVSAGLNF